MLYAEVVKDVRMIRFEMNFYMAVSRIKLHTFIKKQAS